MPSVNGSVEIFCSYSHKDEDYRKEFEAHVAMLGRERLGLVGAAITQRDISYTHRISYLQCISSCNQQQTR